MKNDVNPAAAAIVVILIVAVVGFFLYTRTGGDGSKNAKDNPMPTGAASEMKKMMQGFKK